TARHRVPASWIESRETGRGTAGNPAGRPEIQEILSPPAEDSVNNAEGRAGEAKSHPGAFPRRMKRGRRYDAGGSTTSLRPTVSTPLRTTTLWPGKSLRWSTRT